MAIGVEVYHSLSGWRRTALALRPHSPQTRKRAALQPSWIRRRGGRHPVSHGPRGQDSGPAPSLAYAVL